MEAPWTSNETSASGQVFEFRLWALLTEQSRGSLHVFLPLSDRGIDALIHRRTDDTYIPVQAKCRSSLQDGQVHIAVWAESLHDDSALIVSGLVTDGGLGPTLLVISEGDFKRLALLSSDRGKALYSAEFGMRPRARSKYFSHLVPTDRAVEPFGIPVSTEAVAPAPPAMGRSVLGFLGEAETMRLLAESEDLNLFRPFPDLETSELAVLNLESRRVIGIQVKTVSVDPERSAGTVTIHESSFRPSPATYFVCLGWLREEHRFHAECLLIPSEEVKALCRPRDSTGHISFDWNPGSTRGQLAKYARPLDALPQVLSADRHTE